MRHFDDPEANLVQWKNDLSIQKTIPNWVVLTSLIEKILKRFKISQFECLLLFNFCLPINNDSSIFVRRTKNPVEQIVAPNQI